MEALVLGFHLTLGLTKSVRSSLRSMPYHVLLLIPLHIISRFSLSSQFGAGLAFDLLYSTQNLSASHFCRSLQKHLTLAQSSIDNDLTAL
jgi:hypothetical protein